MRLKNNATLIVIDVQKAFDSKLAWGPRDNPQCEEKISLLCDLWQTTGRPIVCVRHTSQKKISPFATWSPGRSLKKSLIAVRYNVTIEKNVNSAFIGKPDLHLWLQEREITQLVIVGIQTNMCVETTARVAGNLGYEVIVPIDATHTFDIKHGGRTITASELSFMTAANLSAGGFAKVISTHDIIGDYRPSEISKTGTHNSTKEISGEY